MQYILMKNLTLHRTHKVVRQIECFDFVNNSACTVSERGKLVQTRMSTAICLVATNEMPASFVCRLLASEAVSVEEGITSYAKKLCDCFVELDDFSKLTSLSLGESALVILR